MYKLPAIALGAGLASALLFVVSAKGTALAVLLAYFTALPIIITALSFGHQFGLLSAVIGSGTVALVLGPVLSLFFAVSFALPGWWLSYLSLLAQPADLQTPLPYGAPKPLAWYPVRLIVTWAVACAAGAVLVIGAALLWHFGGYDRAIDVLVSRLQSAMAEAEPQNGPAPADMARNLVQIMPVALAASSLLMLFANLWLGARISAMSQRLLRPWPNIPDGFQLPRPAVALLAVCVGLTMLQSPVVASAAATIAAGLAMAFALQGLATAHIVTRGIAGRRAILILIYCVTLLIPLSLVALLLLGIVDSLFPMRFRRVPEPVPAKIKGDR